MSEAGFLNAIRADPTDAATRLIYADYLEERGDVRCELLRLDARLAEPGLDYAEFDTLRVRAKQVRAPLFPKYQKWLASIDLPERYTILLTNEHCDERRRLGKFGKPFDFLAASTWNRFKPRRHVLIYGIRIRRKQVYLVGRLRIMAVLSREEYVERHPDDAPLVGQFERSVIVGDDCLPFRPDTYVPEEVLHRFRYCSGSRESPLKHVQYGELTHPVHLTGVTRITKATGQDLDYLLTGRGEACPACPGRWTLRCP